MIVSTPWSSARSRVTAQTCPGAHHRNFLARYFEPARRDLAHALPDGFRAYDLRHTHASLCFALGMRAEEVAARLGDVVRTVQRWYLHLYDGHDATAIEQLGKLARGASAPSPRGATVLPFEGRASV